MSLVRINRHPSARDLRVFATLWLIFIGAFAVAAQAKAQTVPAIGFGLVAASVALAGWPLPHSIRFIYLAAVYVTFPIGFVLSHVILALVYFLVLTPIGLLMRAFGRDPLQRRFEPDRDSYWLKRDSTRSAESYFRQH